MTKLLSMVWPLILVPFQKGSGHETNIVDRELV